MISTLTVVNDMLGLLGEAPINDLDAFHPMVPRALAQLSTANTTIQGDRWWFNTEFPTLVPQVGTGNILLPTDTLAVDSIQRSPAVAQRGNRLYNLDDSTDVFTEEVKVRLQREVPFDDLPSNPRAYIAAVAKLAFQGTIDGDQQKTGLLREEVKLTHAIFNSEHIRNVRANMLARPGVALRLATIVGQRRLTRGW